MAIEDVFDVYPFIRDSLGGLASELLACRTQIVDSELAYYVIDPLKKDQAILLGANYEVVCSFGGQRLTGRNAFLFSITSGKKGCPDDLQPKSVEQLVLGSRDPESICCIILYFGDGCEAEAYFPVKAGENILYSFKVLKEREKNRIPKLQAEFAAEDAS